MGTVYVVDDDADVRNSLQILLEISGFKVETFESALKFLSADIHGMDGCLVVDIRMPDMDGLQLQDELHRRNLGLPVIIITGHGDVPLAVRAMRAGAIDFLEKPFREETLLDCIRKGMGLRNMRRTDVDRNITARLTALTIREKEVLDLVVEGKTTKEIARILEISPRTVDIHRAHVMEKMHADNLADLVRMVLSARSAPT
jgi:two-component system response regulator FixJ